MVLAGYALLSAGAPLPLFGQVGHDPARSPFRDITSPQGVTFFAGRFGGNRTESGVGPRRALMFGGRFETRLSGPMDLWVTLARVETSRLVVDPTADTSDARRTTGPVSMPLYAGDLALIMNLTGRKSWRRLAPFLGVGFGVVTPQNSVTDPSGYRAGSNFVLAPTIGTRVFLSRRAALRLEGRDYYLRHEWPLSFYSSTDAQGNQVPPVLDASTPEKQWKHNLALAAGLTYHFTF